MRMYACMDGWMWMDAWMDGCTLHLKQPSVAHVRVPDISESRSLLFLP